MRLTKPILTIVAAMPLSLLLLDGSAGLPDLWGRPPPSAFEAGQLRQLRAHAGRDAFLERQRRRDDHTAPAPPVLTAPLERWPIEVPFGLVFAGTAEPQSLVQLTLASGAWVGEARAESDGSWEVLPVGEQALAEFGQGGVVTVTAIATDAAGNVSAASSLRVTTW